MGDFIFYGDFYDAYLLARKKEREKIDLMEKEKQEKQEKIEKELKEKKNTKYKYLVSNKLDYDEFKNKADVFAKKYIKEIKHIYDEEYTKHKNVSGLEEKYIINYDDKFISLIISQPKDEIEKYCKDLQKFKVHNKSIDYAERNYSAEMRYEEEVKFGAVDKLIHDIKQL